MSTATKSLILATVAAFAFVAAAQAQEPGKKPKMHVDIDPAKLPPVAAQKGVTYAKDIRPLFEAACFRCHGEEKQKSGLRLDSLEAVLKGGEERKVVIPGESAKSPLVIATSGLDEEFAMPPRRRVRTLGEATEPGGREPAASEAQNRPPGLPPLPPAIAEAPKGGSDGLRPGGSAGARGPGGAPSKALTAEQVSLVRAWIDQGAK